MMGAKQFSIDIIIIGDGVTNIEVFSEIKVDGFLVVIGYMQLGVLGQEVKESFSEPKTPHFMNNAQSHDIVGLGKERGCVAINETPNDVLIIERNFALNYIEVDFIIKCICIFDREEFVVELFDFCEVGRKQVANSDSVKLEWRMKNIVNLRILDFLRLIRRVSLTQIHKLYYYLLNKI